MRRDRVCVLETELWQQCEAELLTRVRRSQEWVKGVSKLLGSSYFLEAHGFYELATSSPKQPHPFAPVLGTNTTFVLCVP